jgi:membrane-bound inhibitor of C-type lysozyme
MRFGFLGGLGLASLLFPSAAIEALHKPNYGPATIYRCKGQQAFSVSRTSTAANVSFSGQQWSLQRRPSSLGIKYAGGDAVLIVDGASAVLVTNEITGLTHCKEQPRRKS